MSDIATEQLADGKVRLDYPADHVARLTIDSPRNRNALDHPILDAIASALASPALAEHETRCVVLTAVGPVFSAGYDIGGIPREEFPRRTAALVAHPFTNAIEALESYAYPTIAALNGHTIGGGLELALSCDLRVAADGIQVGMPPAKLGLIYSHTGLRKFIDAVGVARTREMFFTGRRYDAATALSWGLVNEVVDAEELEDCALDLAEEIAGNAPISLRGNKEVIRALLAAEGDVRPEVEQELVALRESCFDSEDFFEGVRAFGEKRSPRWQNR